VIHCTCEGPGGPRCCTVHNRELYEQAVREQMEAEVREEADKEWLRYVEKEEIGELLVNRSFAEVFEYLMDLDGLRMVEMVNAACDAGRLKGKVGLP